eukprot:Unigene18477_Nuclearia_a/m.53137 Unigene18477_Nuclearia_a/g.53137  ORF Unigene18477_Nuclearia_a/g.53137 Unigene18477_Nuclearia_a/m.53137 type:complete len:147 (+) Unigene18477_Nuclearia_a:2-442(+)
MLDASCLDPLTRLQDELNQLATLYFTAIGYLQQNAPPVRLPGTPATAGGTAPASLDAATQNVARDFATEIVRTARLIDLHADDLAPLARTSRDEQMRALAELDRLNAEAAERIEQLVRDGRETLQAVRESIAVVLQDQQARASAAL